MSRLKQPVPITKTKKPLKYQISQYYIEAIHAVPQNVGPENVPGADLFPEWDVFNQHSLECFLYEKKLHPFLDMHNSRHSSNESRFPSPAP